MPQFSSVEARSLGLRTPLGLQAAVRTGFIVVPLSLRDLLPRIGQIAEPVLVQTLVAKPPVETFNAAILHRSSGLDRVPLQALLAGPLTAYQHADSSRDDPIRRVLNMELLQFYYSPAAAPCNVGARCSDVTFNSLCVHPELAY